jgi:hypothetical protein
MTDYRLRNHDLLYAGRRPQPLTWRNVAIFGSIVLTVALGVVSHLADRFNAAASGFIAGAPTLVAQDAAPPRPVIQLATPASSRSGS